MIGRVFFFRKDAIIDVLKLHGGFMEYKRLTIVEFAVIGLIIASLSIYVGFEYLVGHNQWLGLIIGVGFMVIGIILYQFGKKHGLSIFYHSSVT